MPYATDPIRETEYVYRLWDPEAKMFYKSMSGGRVIWMKEGAAINTKRWSPPPLRDRLEIKKYKLVEVNYE